MGLALPVSQRVKRWCWTQNTNQTAQFVFSGLITRKNNSMSQLLNKQMSHRLLIIIVFLLAFWVRLWQLANIPPGLKYDEGYIAMDSAWIVETLSPQIYFVNNSGHEALYQNFVAILMSFLGINSYTFRLGSVIIGVLTIAFLYRGITYLFDDNPDRYWLGLLAATALAFSLWQVMLNRMGFQTNTVPLFVMLITYLFWRGWRQQSITYFLAAGVALGISQYTYISARIIPAIYILFTLSWTILTANWPLFLSEKDRLPLHLQIRYQKAWLGLTNNQEIFRLLHPTLALWIGLVLMSFVAVICFLPLGIFFLNNPGAYLERVSQVSLYDSLLTHKVSLTDHFLEAIHPFLIGQNNSIAMPSFTWLDQIGFWLGLVIISRHFYRPTHLFLLISLVSLWMPALLSTGAQSPTRLSGFLVIYYTIMAVGLITGSNWLSHRFRMIVRQPGWNQVVTFFLIALVGCSTTIYTYFYRWGQSPEFYQEYEGSLTKLVQQIITKAHTANVIIPFQLYNYPTTRFLLHNEFREIETPPVNQVGRSTILVTLPNPELIIRLTRIIDNSYVWLTHDSSGQGVAYISHQELSDSDLSALQPIANSELIPFGKQSGEVLATLIPVNIEPILPKFSNWPQFNQLNIEWGHQYTLMGYQIVSDPVMPGQTLVLNLYWQGPTDQPWKYKTVIKFVDERGNLFAEWRQNTFPPESFRWHHKTIMRTSHRLFISPQAIPGPYLVHIEILDPSTNNLTAYTSDGQTLGTEVVLGLAYISAPDVNPRKPAVSMNIQLDNQIDLLGFDPLFPLDLKQRQFRGRLYWQATKQVQSNYVVFVQLLNSQQQIFANWESEPFAGQYPTSTWKTDEVVVHDFDLVLPVELPHDQYQLTVGMVDPTLKAKSKSIILMEAKLP